MCIKKLITLFVLKPFKIFRVRPYEVIFKMMQYEMWKGGRAVLMEVITYRVCGRNKHKGEN